MTAILEAEATRLTEQRRLDQLQNGERAEPMGAVRHSARSLSRYCPLCLGRIASPQRRLSFLDPAIGTGSFFGAFVQSFPQDRIIAATGIELDKPFAEAARQFGNARLAGDPRRLHQAEAGAVYNVILTNPPYVRHHHLAAEEKQRLGELAERATGLRLSGLAGLYCYFLLIAHDWLAENGLAAWLIPSEFMDVNYGDEVKRYLTERVCLRRIHRFCPSDVQFDDALVSSAIVVFENRKPKAEPCRDFLVWRHAHATGQERNGLRLTNCGPRENGLRCRDEATHDRRNGSGNTRRFLHG